VHDVSLLRLICITYKLAVCHGRVNERDAAAINRAAAG
jgi:hypothetical protein